MNNAAIQYAGSSGGSAELTAAEQAGLAKAAALTATAAQIDAAAAIASSPYCKWVKPGDDLDAAIDWLFHADRVTVDGWAAASATAMRNLILLPGRYVRTAVAGRETETKTLVLNAARNFLHMFGITGNRSTVITSAGGVGAGATVRQTANCIYMSNLTIENTGTEAENNGLEIDAEIIDSGTQFSVVTGVNMVWFKDKAPAGGYQVGDHVAYVDAATTYYIRIYAPTDATHAEPLLAPEGGATRHDCSAKPWTLYRTNAASRYTDCLFRSANGITDAAQGPVRGVHDINGTWIRCEDEKIGTTDRGYGWRCEANMIVWGDFHDCIFRGFSVGSDMPGNEVWGTFYRPLAGMACFGGCAGTGCDVYAKFYDILDCGPFSVALNKIFGGEIHRGHFSGPGCISGCNEENTGGVVLPSAVIEDARLTGKSLGAGGAAGSYCSGTLDNVTLTGMSATMNITGATIRNSRIVATGTDISTLTLKDSNSKIQNSTIVATGSGNSITAGSALNVACTGVMVNLDKHENVTNTGIALTVNAAVN